MGRVPIVANVPKCAIVSILNSLDQVFLSFRVGRSLAANVWVFPNPKCETIGREAPNANIDSVFHSVVIISASLFLPFAWSIDEDGLLRK